MRVMVQRDDSLLHACAKCAWQLLTYIRGDVVANSGVSDAGGIGTLLTGSDWRSSKHGVVEKITISKTEQVHNVDVAISRRWSDRGGIKVVDKALECKGCFACFIDPDSQFAEPCLLSTVEVVLACSHADFMSESLELQCLLGHPSSFVKASNVEFDLNKLC